MHFGHKALLLKKKSLLLNLLWNNFDLEIAIKFHHNLQRNSKWHPDTFKYI